ncbi:MAG: hypothetical protein AAB426_13295 [Myxococcota bacterium]
MKWTVVVVAVLATARVAAAQCPPCAESWQTPDANCYCALYECKAGNPRCDVDVAVLGSRTCDQTITASTPWSSINWSNNTICIEAGNHLGKGTLTVPAVANGSSGNHKVLRYTRGSDNDDEPWNQSGTQANVQRLVVQGDYWLIHRLTFPTISGGLDKPVRVEVVPGNGDVTNVIFNRMLIVGSDYLYYGYSQDGSSGSIDWITVQNSVLRGWYGNGTSDEVVGLDIGTGSNMHAVNNEIYDVAAHQMQVGHNGGPTLSGIVIENNDLYYSPTAQTTDGTKVKGENTLSFKASGASDSAALIIDNRIWGNRVTDFAFCCNGSSGPAVAFGAGGGTNSDWILFKGNVVLDSQQGIEWTHWNQPSSGNRVSVIGNIFYQIGNFSGTPEQSTVWWAGSGGVNTTEHYLNTIVESAYLAQGLFDSNNDFRCNVAIKAGTNVASNGSGTQWDHNAYYATQDAGESNRVAGAIIQPGRLSAYALDEVLEAPERNDFLYRVTTAGTSAAAPPGYCTTVGCTTQDGTMTVQATRGPYCFYRKLRTAPEQLCIPYATVHESAPEYGFCRAENMGGVPLGSRPGIGISDDVAPW